MISNQSHNSINFKSYPKLTIFNKPFS